MKNSLNVTIFAVILFLFGTYAPVSHARETTPVNRHYRHFADAEALRFYMTYRPGATALISAHRGGPMEGFPENAIETFENAVKYGPCLIECDVRLSKDGHLVMMHDETLDRTTTGKGKVTDYTLKELKQLYLKTETDQVKGFRIPTFGEVLEWAKTRAVLTVDVKRNVPFESVIREIRAHNAEGHAIIITYNLDDLKKVHQLAPDLMISGPAQGVKGTEKLLASGVPLDRLCAFVGVSEPEPIVYHMLHKRGIRAILGTLHNLDKKAAARGIKVYKDLIENGADILATDNVRGVGIAIYGEKK